MFSLSLTVVPGPAVRADAAGVPPARVLAPEVVAALRAAAVLVVLALAPAARHQRVAAVPGRARAHLNERIESFKDNHPINQPNQGYPTEKQTCCFLMSSTCRLVVAAAVGAGLAAGVDAARVRVAEVLPGEAAARHERVAGETCGREGRRRIR